MKYILFFFLLIVTSSSFTIEDATITKTVDSATGKTTYIETSSYKVVTAIFNPKATPHYHVESKDLGTKEGLKIKFQPNAKGIYMKLEKAHVA